jgi:hypothetical protein
MEGHALLVRAKQLLFAVRRARRRCLQAEKARVATIQAGASHNADHAAPLATVFTVVAGILRATSAPAIVQYAAASVAWGLAVNSAARAAMAESGVVTALLDMASRLAYLTSGGRNEAAEHGGADGKVDEQASQHRASLGMPVDATAGPRSEGDTESQGDMLAAVLSALGVFMVDANALTVFMDAAKPRKGFLLQPLLDLAAVQLLPKTNEEQSVSTAGSASSDCSAQSRSAVALADASAASPEAVTNSAVSTDPSSSASASQPPVLADEAQAGIGDIDPDTGALGDAAQHSPQPSVAGPADHEDDVTDTANDVAEPLPACHRRLAIAVLATLLCRDARARTLCASSGALPQVAALLESDSMLVQQHAAACLAAFATAEDAMASQRLQLFGGALDAAGLAQVLCSKLGTVDALLASGQERVTEAGGHATELAELHQALAAALQHAIAAALSLLECSGSATMVIGLVRLADECMRRSATLHVAAAGLCQVCASRMHAERLLFSLEPVSVEQVSPHFGVPLDGEAPEGSTTMAALVVRTLVHVMGAGAYPLRCWQALLPSAVDPDQPDWPVPLPQQAATSRGAHVAGGPHLCQAAAAAALVALALLPDQHSAASDSDAQYRGPLREMLLELGVIPYLLDLAHAGWTERGSLASVRSTVATGLMAVVAPGAELPRNQLQDMVAYAAERSQAGDLQPDEYQQLAAALWFALRNANNGAYLNGRTELLSVASELARVGVAHVLCYKTIGQPGSGVRSAWCALEIQSLIGAMEGTVAKGLELLVLVLWVLLQRTSLASSGGIGKGASCYGRSNTTWWQLPLASRCESLGRAVCYVLNAVLLCCNEGRCAVTGRHGESQHAK